MSWQSAWVTIALGAWLGAACGSRSELGAAERLGDADPAELELAGAANSGGTEPDGMNGSGGLGGVDPTRPGTGGTPVPDPTVITPPLPPRPEWFPRGEMRLRPDELLRSAEALLGAELQPPQRAYFGQKHLMENLSAEARAGSGVSDEWLDEVLSQVTDEQLRVALGCDPDMPCSADALRQFASRAWRKPLSDEEYTKVDQAFETAALSGADGGVRGFVRAILAEPEFALLSLMGEQVGDAHLLTDFELASQLSFQFGGRPPDAELWDATAAGILRNRDGRVAQATRLLQTAEGRTYIGEWVAHWFEAVAFEDTQHPLGAETLNGETQRLLFHVLFDGQQPLQRLLDADYTFVNQDLAEWYGLPDVGEGWSLVSLVSTTRRGIPHHASWLGQRQLPDYQDYARRGTLPFELVCRQLPPPPAELDVDLLEQVPEGTPREQMEAYTSRPECAGCHQMLNPVAFSFDSYDGWGQYRTTFSGGEPIDTSGDVKMANGDHYLFADSSDFVTQLAASDAYLDCFRRVWVGSGTGVGVNDAGLQSYLQNSKRASLFTELALQFVASEHYVYRR